MTSETTYMFIPTAEEFIREKIRAKNEFPPTYKMEGLQNQRQKILLRFLNQRIV